MKNLYFKKNDYYLVPGSTCNEIHAVLHDMKKLAELYLSSVTFNELLKSTGLKRAGSR